MNKIKLLDPYARGLVSPAFCSGEAEGDFADHFREAVDFDHVDVDPLVRIVKEGMSKFTGMATKSDAWFASRVHACLRLNRREASDQRLWDYIAVILLSEYVRWRWSIDESSDGKALIKRFIGNAEYIHAIARLWWGAELTRNGPDYSCVRHLFANQDLQNSWARCIFFHHRPIVLASLRTLATLNDGEFATSDQIRDIVKTMNMVLTTTSLDAVVCDPGVDAETIDNWRLQEINETKWYEDEPEGPGEAQVAESDIAAAQVVVKRVISLTRFGRRLRTKA